MTVVAGVSRSEHGLPYVDEPVVVVPAAHVVSVRYVLRRIARRATAGQGLGR